MTESWPGKSKGIPGGRTRWRESERARQWNAGVKVRDQTGESTAVNPQSDALMLLVVSRFDEDRNKWFIMVRSGMR